MQKIFLKDIYPNRDIVSGDIGLEVEVEAETDTLPVINNTNWTTKGDNSLRNGLEYITKGAFKVDSKKLYRIQKLTEILNKPALKVLKDSHRTSVHVHRNLQDFDIMEIWTTVAAGWLMENLLFKYCGPFREGNLFCLRFKDAEGVLQYVLSDLKSGYAFSQLDTDTIRYAAQNLSAIPQYGSLEYRGMHGTINAEKIDVWSTGLFDMGNNARKYFTSPENLLDYYYINGWQKIVRLLFNDPLMSILLLIKNGGDLVEQNAVRLTTFAYATDWTRYHESMVKVYSKIKIAEKKKTIPAGTVVTPDTINQMMDDMAADPWPQIPAWSPRIRRTNVAPTAPQTDQMLERRPTWDVPIAWN